MKHNSKRKTAQAGEQQAVIKKSQNYSRDNSTNAQQQRLIAALKESPKSTIELRRDFDVMHPSGRVFELKKRGYAIITNWRQEATDCGKLHRVALYVLLGESEAI